LVLGLELKALLLEPLHQLVFVKGFFEIGFCKLFARAGLNHDPPDFRFLGS
jgi:hypothetical protein